MKFQPAFLQNWPHLLHLGLVLYSNIPVTQEQNLLTGQKPWLQLFIKRIQSQTLLIIVLFLLLQGFCYKDKRTEIQSSVLKKSSIKEALFKEFFFLVFVFKFIVLVLTTLWHLLSISQYSLENVYKSCENVSFCFYTDQNNAPKKRIGGRSGARGQGIDHHERKKLQILGVCTGGRGYK